MPRRVEPATRYTAFNCPYCDTLCTQTWYTLRAFTLDEEHPQIFQKEELKNLNYPNGLPDEVRAQWRDFYKRLADGDYFLDEDLSNGGGHVFCNAHLSECFECGRLAFWIYDRLIVPTPCLGIEPNSDLSPEIRADFEEALKIAPLSPRGAAALLRLCVQKLCIELGEKGKKVDDDIASLVRKGLSPLIQKSLDIVRVIGNEAVHPGALDLKDDRETAGTLFELVNSIADHMISHPKHVRGVYDRLPEGIRKRIEERDKPRGPAA